MAIPITEFRKGISIRLAVEVIRELDCEARRMNERLKEEGCGHSEDTHTPLWQAETFLAMCNGGA